MGISTKPVQRWEALKVPGITIKPGGSGIVVEMTVDGAARLVEHVQRWKVGKGDSRLFELFLEELVQQGKVARRRQA